MCQVRMPPWLLHVVRIRSSLALYHPRSFLPVTPIDPSTGL